MPKLPEPRDGVGLRAYSRSVPFSFWPTGQGAPRPPVQSLLFALDPWVIMRRAIIENVNNLSSRAEAISYIDQAADFYNSAATSSIQAAKPVQLYYAYLNIAKAFIICRGLQFSLPNIHHGINEAVLLGGAEFSGAYVKLWTSPNLNGLFQAFDEFMNALQFPRLPNKHQISIHQLIPQILSGHRLWASAAHEEERFIALQRIQFFESRGARQVWLRMYLFADDIKRLGYTQNGTLSRSGFAADFQKVKCEEKVEGRPLICFEQTNPLAYRRHGVDFANELVKIVKSRLWATAGSSSPYRRYYLYLCPPGGQANLIPQIASIYALTFYFGSVTRYRPNAFQEILTGAYGPRVSEFVAGQPAQFVYLMASEFARRDVTRPSIV